MVQETAIRPISDELPNVPHPFGFIRPSKSAEAGSHAGVHTETVRAEYRAGNEERAYWYCIHYCLRDEVKHMTEAEVKDWAIRNGYKIDGQVKREWVYG